MMRSEESCRRPDFEEGEPVRLADGQEWHVPRPKIRVSPRLVDGKVELSIKVLYGSPELEGRIEAIEQAEDPAERIRALYGLAIDLLGRNYDLTPEEYAELLAFTIGDEEGEAMLLAVFDVAVGNAQKASTAG